MLQRIYFAITASARKASRKFKTIFIRTFSTLSGKDFNKYQYILRYLTCNKDLFFIQIGAHAGGIVEPDKGSYSGHLTDPIHTFVKRYKWKGLLVEPQKKEFELLKGFYRSEASNLTFSNKAICAESGKRKFSICESSMQSSFANVKGDPNRRIKKVIPVDCITFNELLKNHNIQRIDLLVIDVEGYEYEIIKTIDFSRVVPKAILYEHKHISHTDRKICDSLLRNAGYRIKYQDNIDTLTVFTG